MQWFALRVKSKHEKKVSFLLRSRSLQSFTPLYTARHRWADRLKTVQLPLFPGYVFCAFGGSQRTTVLQTPGVVDVVGVGHIPAAIDEGEIQALQELVASGCNAEPWPALVVGKAATIIAGPLAGISGVVIRHKTGLRLVLSVTLLRSSVLVEVDRLHVKELPSMPMSKAIHSSAVHPESCYLAHTA